MTDPRRAWSRAAEAPYLADLVAELRAAAATAVAQDPPAPPSWSLYRSYADTGNRLGYERVYFARRGRLNALAAATLIDGEPAVAAALADMLWSVCDEYTWALPAHERHAKRMARPMPQCVDLFACETAHTLAETVTLLADRLPAEVVRRVRAEVWHRVLDPLFAEPASWPWESYRNNWSAVCAGAAGMAALLLIEDDAVLDIALRRCLRNMHTYLRGLGADGGCAEGIDYWVYGFGYLTYFAEALRQRTGRDLLRDTPQCTAVAGFAAAAQTGPGRFVSFSDASESPTLPPGLLSRLHERLDAPIPGPVTVPPLSADPCHRWAHLSRTLTWTDPHALAGSPTPPGTSWLPDLAWLVDRRTIDGRPVAFAAKGGRNDEPHNHHDLGHFVVVADGEQLLTDLGAGEYTDAYFGPGRYDLPHPSTHAHSVPIVDGRAQRAGAAARALVLDQSAGVDGTRLALDLSAAYGDRRVCRELRWRADGSLTLRDTFANADTVDELFVSRIAPTLTDGMAVWSGRGCAAILRYDPAGWRPVVKRLNLTDHDGRPDTAYRLCLRSVARPAPVAAFELSLRPVA